MCRKCLFDVVELISVMVECRKSYGNSLLEKRESIEKNYRRAIGFDQPTARGLVARRI
jgi:hypothetical protein